MSDKLLHERLREWAASEQDEVGLDCLFNFMSGVEGCPASTSCGRCDKAQAAVLADEIERFYVPRPRYEDGEPVQFGDEYQADSGRTAKMRQLCAYAHGGFVIGKKGKRATIGDGELVKRPASKLLDADGIELKVGDTVWHVVSGRRGTVELCKEPIVIVDWDDGGFSAGIPAASLTHQEPDSLEKLRDDLDGFMRDCEINENKVDEFCDRITALIERGA